MNQVRNNLSMLRMATVRWIGRLLAVSLDVGALTVGEYNIVMKTLRDAAKKGETKEPEVPLRLIDGREAANLLNVSYSQFRALESEGVFPFRRKMLGKKTVRYRITDINNYILSDDATLYIDDTKGAPVQTTLKRDKKGRAKITLQSNGGMVIY